MYATFFYYWEKDRIAAVFILYSLGFSILLAAMTVYVENFSMISKAAGIYSISTVVFVYWVGKEFEEGRLDPEVLQPAEPDSDDANDEDR